MSYHIRGEKHPLYKHGFSKHPMYQTWKNMKGRCHNPNRKDYHLYGGRGVTVCDRWRHSFPNFLEDMGERPEGMTVERKDSSAAYGPDNCRWATWKEQAQNRRPKGSIDGK